MTWRPRGHRPAGLLGRAYSSAGQTWLKTLASVLTKPPSQDLVSAAFDCLRALFRRPPRGTGPRTSRSLTWYSRQIAWWWPWSETRNSAWCLGQHPPLAADLAAMHILSGLGYGVIRPVLPDPTTQGTLMRRKLAPVLDPILDRISLLRGGQR